MTIFLLLVIIILIGALSYVVLDRANEKYSQSDLTHPEEFASAEYEPSENPDPREAINANNRREAASHFDQILNKHAQNKLLRYEKHDIIANYNRVIAQYLDRL